MPPDGLDAGHGGREIAFDVDVGVVGDVEHDFDDFAAVIVEAGRADQYGVSARQQESSICGGVDGGCETKS
jgi:hypothetical protein